MVFRARRVETPQQEFRLERIFVSGQQLAQRHLGDAGIREKIEQAIRVIGGGLRQNIHDSCNHTRISTC